MSGVTIGAKGEMLGEVRGRDRARFAAARREPAVRLQDDGPRRGRLKDLPQDLIVALPAAALAIETDLVEVGLARDLKEPLRGAQPNRAGGRIDRRERAVQELFVELGWRKVRAGQLGRRLECFLNLATVSVLFFRRPGRVGAHGLSPRGKFGRTLRIILCNRPNGQGKPNLGSLAPYTGFATPFGYEKL